MKKTVLSFISLLLAIAFLLNLSGCKNDIKSQNLMKNVTAQKVDLDADLSDGNAKMTDFAVRLFKECETSGENTLVSPLSVMYALAMTANGADGNTLSQMEAVFGMPVNELNNYLYSYKNSLPQGEKYKLNLANSIWIHNSFDVKQEFLQSNANYYNIDVYKADLNKAATLKDINNWVNDKTDKMIPKMVDEKPDSTVMYLINALTFDAEWGDKYPTQKVKDGIFTCEDGTTQNISLMYKSEYYYIEDDNAQGFIKHYVDDKYAFVALLPDEDITVSEYVKTLDGAKLNQMLLNQEDIAVETAVPKFKTEYSVELPKVLEAMGMVDAFYPGADFSKLGNDVFVDAVTHKTFIDVNEKGTTAAAATYVGVKKGISKTKKTIYLNRPFVYMIIDCQNNVPIFMGTVMSVQN